MKYALVAVAVAILAALPLRSLFAPSHGFDAAVSAIQQQYHPRQQHIPLQWFASLCATLSTGGGVRHMRVANFEHVNGLTSPDDLAALLTSRLSPDWHQMVLTRHTPEDFNLVYVRPQGDAMRMLVATYDHGELDLVRMDLNGRRLAHFVQDPAHTATHHNTLPD